MRNLIICALACLLTPALSAQLFERGQVWVNTDSIPRDNSLVGRHALLSVYWNINSRGVHNLNADLDKLVESYPWLSIVTIHLPSNSLEADVDLIKRYTKKYGISHLGLVDTTIATFSSISGLTAITYDLTAPDGNLELDGLSLSKNKSELIKRLESIQNNYSTPGKSLQSSFYWKSRSTVSDVSLLSQPSHLIYDDSQRRLMISDTGNDRVVICSSTGEVREAIGTGRKGDNLQDFDMSSLNNPMGLAYDAQSDKLLIADYGNNRIVSGDLTSRILSEYQVADEDGYQVSFPGAITDLDLNDNRLTITMPLARRVWVVNHTQGRLIQEYGKEGVDAKFHKRLKKLVLGNPIAAVSSGDYVFIYDAQLRSLLSITDEVVTCLWSMDSEIVKKHGGALSEEEKIITGIEFHDGLLYLIEGDNGKVLEIDSEKEHAKPYVWNTDSLDCGLISSIAWSDKETFLLNSEDGDIIIKDDQSTDHLRWTQLDRLNAGDFSGENLIALPDTYITDSMRVVIKIELDFPERFILHPSHRSHIFLSSGSQVFEENTDLRKGPIELIALKDFNRNQINLMGDIFFTEIGKPWIVYRRFVQIMVPISKRVDGKSEVTLKANLLEGLSGCD